ENVVILKYLLISKHIEGINGLDCVNSTSKIKIRDKSGTFIGMRMGRPEKAKLRKMKGSPHVLFPVGAEGGRLRSFQAALKSGSVNTDWPIFECQECRRQTIYPVCEVCGKKTTAWRICPTCKKKTRKTKCHTETKTYERKKLDVKHHWRHTLKQLKISNPPPLIKGVRGTSNKDHYPEHLAKGVLRAKHNIYVNKDGTVRYDITEMGCTHFKPKEIGTSIDKLKELGYTKDIKGKTLENENQTLEIFPQDVILPKCPEAKEDGADTVLHKVSKFVDEELKLLYSAESFYNLTKPSDLIGHLIIGLAPHTSAGIVGRIIGFSETQGCFSHPYWHAAQRRNLDGDETCVILLMDAFLNFSRQYLPDRRGGRSMDAPLVLTTVLIPSEVDSEVHNLDIIDKYPLEFYKAAQECKSPFKIKIKTIKKVLGTSTQYEKMSYTHESKDMNAGVRFSAYKAIPTMVEKLEGQIDLAAKIRAVDLSKVAALVINKHFLRDIKGNLRKFTKQQFRCTTCNEKYRRPPLAGNCKCGGKIVYTIAEGTIKKYLEPSLKLVKYDGVPAYMKQTMDLLKRRIESIFGKEKTKQIGLGGFIAK
ncbi:DNA polymerase II large subunit, partial [Candidatus Woesearchaeota archaeon]|nr:DNA polymerase II large subunit [Candidatus Woesearchaeota archaeon]